MGFLRREPEYVLVECPKCKQFITKAGEHTYEARDIGWKMRKFRTVETGTKHRCGR